VPAASSVQYGLTPSGTNVGSSGHSQQSSGCLSGRIHCLARGKRPAVGNRVQTTLPQQGWGTWWFYTEGSARLKVGPVPCWSQVFCSLLLYLCCTFGASEGGGQNQHILDQKSSNFSVH
jgi:hypothetical protein